MMRRRRTNVFDLQMSIEDGVQSLKNAHRTTLHCTAIEAVGAYVRFLPPYSPDFNPIEQAFAKLKAFLRAARPRTFDRVSTLVADALKLFPASECGNYVRHCGYRLAVQL